MEDNTMRTKCCPECFCDETIHDDTIDKGYHVCVECHQEWWTDIDYGDDR